MATLDPSNIVNGNIIEPNDILQLYSALGSTNPGSITGLVMTGSLDGSATSIIIPSPATSTGTYYPTLVPGVGTQNLEIGTLEYNAATDTLTTTASYATLASTSTSVDMYTSQNGVPATSPPSNFIPIGGTVTLVGGTFPLNLSTIFPGLTTPISGFGVDLIMTATDITSPQAVQLSFSLGIVTFTGTGTDIISYSGWIKS